MSANGIQLRDMSPDEYRRLSRFSFERFALNSASESGQPVEEVRARIGSPPEAISSGDLWKLIECDGQEAGYIWVRITPGSREAFGYEIFLEEAFRGRGVGRAVMLSGRELLRTRGVDRLRICVFGKNQPARKLYESLGFRQVDFNQAKNQFTLEIEV